MGYKDCLEMMTSPTPMKFIVDFDLTIGEQFALIYDKVSQSLKNFTCPESKAVPSATPTQYFYGIDC